VLVRHSLPQLLHGEPVGRVWSFQDITHFKRAEASLRAQQEALNLAHSDQAATLEAIPDLLFELDEDGRYLDYRAGQQDLLAAPPAQLLGHTVAEVLPPEAAAEVMAALTEAKANGHSYGRQIGLDLPQGRAWFELSVARKKGPSQGQARFILISRDISMRKQHEDLIWNQANYDALTGLPNRRMFRHHLETSLTQARASGEHLALMFLDLDRFKEINDTHGHDMGDHLLQTAAQRLRAAVRETDMVARMGGDEFTLLIAGKGVAERATALCATLLQRMAEPFHLGAELDYVSASIGITLFPDDAPDAESLIKQADQAMYAAKRLGRNRHERFTSAMQEATLVRSRVARDLRGALSGQQFWLAYQPVVDLRTGAIHKAEALIRWQHPTQGAVSPATFIPIAEESGSIHEIGQWVFETAAAQVAQWRRTLHPGFQISINTSPLQYQRQGLQPDALQAHLRTLGLDGSSLVLEITEGLLMDASAATRQQLSALHTAGFEISLDDFGTGYSALSYLHQFDLNYLKIDQSFVRDLHAGSKDLALCKATIVMAHELGLKVVAEGIETTEQRDLLAQAGCDFGQGYLFSRPVSAADFEAMLLATPANPAASV
jgi:diguanylate cyclase (GGDEF)-like protein/PAS domain S-box-containing protein